MLLRKRVAVFVDPLQFSILILMRKRVAVFVDPLIMVHDEHARDPHEDSGRDKQDGNRNDNDRPTGVRQRHYRVRAAASPAKVCRASDIIESDEQRAASSIEHNRVAQLSVLPHVGVELGRCALDEEPFFVLEDGEERGIRFVENKDPAHREGHHPEYTQTHNHELDHRRSDHRRG